MHSPIMDELFQFLSSTDAFKKSKIGWHCHLTHLTALAVEVLVKLDCAVSLSECNSQTTDLKAVSFMEKLGAKVFLGANGRDNVLKDKPEIISDTGFQLIEAYLQKGDFPIIGACEITTSGITKLRAQENLPICVINLNDGMLKSQIENFHGVGLGVKEIVETLDGSFSNQTAYVVGYGQVGHGCAFHLHQLGFTVFVVESDPIKALCAHFDGFALATLDEAMSCAQLLVTATGSENLITKRHFQLASDKLVIINVGHFANELDLTALKKIVPEAYLPNEFLDHYEVVISAPTSQYAEKKTVYIATGGHPANVVLMTGPSQPTEIHLTNELLAMAYLKANALKELPKGELALPPCVEAQTARLVLKALNLGNKCA